MGIVGYRFDEVLAGVGSSVESKFWAQASTHRRSAGMEHGVSVDTMRSTIDRLRKQGKPEQAGILLAATLGLANLAIETTHHLCKYAKVARKRM